MFVAIEISKLSRASVKIRTRFVFLGLLFGPNQLNQISPRIFCFYIQPSVKSRVALGDVGEVLTGTIAAATRQFSYASVVEKVVSGGEREESGGGDTRGRRLFSSVYGKRSAVIAKINGMKRGTLSTFDRFK